MGDPTPAQRLAAGANTGSRETASEPRSSGRGVHEAKRAPVFSFCLTVRAAALAIMSACALPRPPHIEAAGNTTRDQRPARLEFRIPRVLDQDNVIEIEPVPLTDRPGSIRSRSGG